MAAALADVDAVIHSAGIAHAMSGLPEDDYRLLNTEATIGLARAAQRAGARRFIFLPRPSAQRTDRRRVLTQALARNRRAPMGARSFAEPTTGAARPGLGRIAARPGLWPGMKGDMAELVRLARARYPLPLGALDARRSLLSLDNLVAAVDTVLTAPAPLRRPLIVADPEPLTIPDMIAAMRRGLGRRPGLIPRAAAVAGSRLACDRPGGDLPAPGRIAGRRPGGLDGSELDAAGRDPRRASRCSRANRHYA